MKKSEFDKFNLVTSPWIKVINSTNGRTEEVSLEELFVDTSKFARLGGEMAIQDLSILRLLLAILTTVYLRFDEKGNNYPWFNLKEKLVVEKNNKFEQFDNEEKDEILLTTWKNLYHNGSFTEIVLQYLKENKELFQLSGQTPFYLANKDEYNKWTQHKEKNGKIEVKIPQKLKTDSGNLSVKTMNRRISESGNSTAIFSPKLDNFKNDINISEFVRWLITYQNFSDTSGKVKLDKVIKKQKQMKKGTIRVSKGWLYTINPVYLKGNNLFETLMLNLILTPSYIGDGTNKDNFYIPLPTWEESIDDYIDRIPAQEESLNTPSNLSELYTMLARLICIMWVDEENPVIFSTGLPWYEETNAFIEPMTIWEKGTDGSYAPLKTSKRTKKLMDSTMWQNFGLYIKVNKNDSDEKPGIVTWVKELRKYELIFKRKILSLKSVILISDGTASNTPYLEIVDDMAINADVLLGDGGKNDFKWVSVIEDTIQETKNVKENIEYLGGNIAKLRNMSEKGSKAYQKRLANLFYNEIDSEFRLWLLSIDPEDRTSDKVKEWRDTVNRIVKEVESYICNNLNRKDIIGVENEDGKIENIFTHLNKFRGSVYNILHG